MVLIIPWFIQHYSAKNGAVSSSVKETLVFYRRPGREITSATAISFQASSAAAHLIMMGQPSSSRIREISSSTIDSLSLITSILRTKQRVRTLDGPKIVGNLLV